MYHGVATWKAALQFLRELNAEFPSVILTMPFLSAPPKLLKARTQQILVHTQPNNTVHSGQTQNSTNGHGGDYETDCAVSPQWSGTLPQPAVYTTVWGAVSPQWSGTPLQPAVYTTVGGAVSPQWSGIPPQPAVCAMAWRGV